MDYGVFGPNGVYAPRLVAMVPKQEQGTVSSAVPPFLGALFIQATAVDTTRNLKLATTGNVPVC